MQPPFPAYSGDEPYVFVCYSHDDDRVVYPELSWLKAQGLNVWYDEGISAGLEWSQALADALEGCAMVLFYASPNSVASEHCRREISFAVSNALPICMVYLEETRLPGSLALSLGHRQALMRHALPAAEYSRKLLDALHADTTGIVAAAPRVVPVRSRWTWIAPAVVLIAVIALSLGYWLIPQSGESGPPPTSIAVIAFEDLSPSGDQAWLAHGIAEALQVYLGRVEQLHVRIVPAADPQTLDLADLAGRYQVGSVLLGSIQRVEDELAVSARLISTADGSQAWTGRYDVTVGNVFTLQQNMAAEIIRAIETELGIELPPKMREMFNDARYGTSDLRAYEMWRRSLELKNIYGGSGPPSKQKYEEALEYNLKAVEIDPNFAMGFASLGFTYYVLSYLHGDPEDRAAAIRAYERAMELDPGNVIAIANRIVIASEDEDWALSVRLAAGLKEITDLAGVFRAFTAYQLALANLGRWDDAEAMLDRLLKRVDRSPEVFLPDDQVHWELAFALISLRRDYDQLIERYGQRIENDWSWAPPAKPAIVFAYRAAKREAEAVEVYLAREPEAARELLRKAYAEGGWSNLLRATEADRQRRGARCDSFLAAELHEDAALYDCMQQKSPGFYTIWMMPQFDAYRDDPRFLAILDAHHIVGYRNRPF